MVHVAFVLPKGIKCEYRIGAVFSEHIDDPLAELDLGYIRKAISLIPKLYDFGNTGQNYYISMEYVRGKDLRSILRNFHAEIGCRTRCKVSILAERADDKTSPAGQSHARDPRRR
jgi:serine/threonine protein kinase